MLPVKGTNIEIRYQLLRNFFHLAGKAVHSWAVLLDRLSHPVFVSGKQYCRWEKRRQGHAETGKIGPEGRDGVSDLDLRIEAMHRRDVLIAWGFVAGLWLAMIFVAWATWSLAPNGTVRVMLMIAGAIILLFNTAAILAMLRHYREDRNFMYGLDIKFLDEARARKG